MWTIKADAERAMEVMESQGDMQGVEPQMFVLIGVRMKENKYDFLTLLCSQPSHDTSNTESNIYSYPNPDGGQ
jgi:hypothetical protein